MWSVAKALYRTWALILFLIKKYISNDILKVKLRTFPTYNPNEIWWTIFYHSPLHGTIQFYLECRKSSVLGMIPNTILKNLKIIIRRLESEIKKSQHTIIMKFCGPLDIIVHYAVQFNLECCKSSVSDMGPNTILIIKQIIIRRLKSEITKFQTYNH